MTGRWQATTAWALAALTLVAVAADTAVTAVSGPGLWSTTTVSRHGWPLVPAACLGCSVVGALIVSRYARHPIGWLLVSAGTVSAVSLVMEAYSIWVHRYGGPGGDRAWQLSGWVSILLSGGVAVNLLAIVFLTAPDGRLLSRRWRPVLWLCLLGMALYVATALLVHPSDAVVDTDRDAPDFPSLASVTATSGALISVIGTVGAFVSMLVRLRRARGDARLQLRWFAVAAGLLAFGFAWLLGMEASNGGHQTPLASLPLFAGFFALPVLAAIAVLRHRLYDIDLIVSRAAALTVATALVAAGYVVVVLVVAGKASGSGVWSSLLATAVVAVAFQPLRARVVRFAHRVAYGRRAAPYEALADLSRSLQDSPDPQQLLPQLAAAAAGAVAANQATVTLDVPGAAPLRATWPPDPATASSGTASVVPLVDAGERLGEVTVVLPAGRALRDADRQLLDRLAAQAALALRNSRLAAELAARVAEVEAQAAAVDRSRRRLIDARDAERDRIEASIHRDVMGHLDPLPDTLDALAARLAESPARRRLDGLADPAVAALEALRAITRGVYPAQLARFGLPAVLSRTDARQAGVTIDDGVLGRRFDDRVEATAYFCFTELTRAPDGRVAVWLGLDGDGLLLRITGASPGEGTLARMRDRVEAVGGELSADGPLLRVRIPTGGPVPPPAAALSRAVT